MLCYAFVKVQLRNLRRLDSPTIREQILLHALIDGASRFQAFSQVVIPQAVPGMISTGIFVFIMCWGEYVYPLVLIASDDRKTVALILAALSGGGENIKFGLLMAGSTLATLPILVLFLFVQKYLIQGFASGGVD